MSKSITAKLTLTAIESWQVESHWRSAVIIAVVGTIGFSLAKPPMSAPKQAATSSTTIQQQTSSNQTINNQPTAITNSPNVTITPTKLKPTLSQDDVNIIIEEKDKDNDFGKSFGE